ncbi:alpha/beta-type small acid-soluble spore protein [Effusibacillus lacus]|uniref:Small, acid-soluble spore protein, alpha/beta type n=1 Tax=Effusibacillus lacus TaxID=1348429 RepID=A0A292YL76_9BACL|nr:alpha/beta-type small acid-soluble spore protein [Effusibacillus lacus]TCS72864.1 small acid-soluble spore protein alpha/beta type [Effusibacillus lacus]GAX89210.1 small, acid-soluble spore protein, alpha/beta type [Effusibacillus lacus]
MARRRRILNPNAGRALDRLKYEVASELGLDDDIQDRGWENMTTREVGLIGGNMVRKMINFAEAEMAERNGRIGMPESNDNLQG